jgi:hypothetical protein
VNTRCIAVDWSGRKTGAAKYIWLAEARDGALGRLEGGRDREQIVEHLVGLHRDGDRLTVGLDFGFSFPEWYLRERGLSSAPDMWRWLAKAGRADQLLAVCERPFWGAPGKPRHEEVTHYRRTELAVEAAEGARPKSLFQIGGAGAVGTGSIRGMRALHALREAGFAIWPFDKAGPATAVEIYPRLFSHGVKKVRRGDRRDHLQLLQPGLSAALFEHAASSDDAFDAAISAIAMSRHASALQALPAINDSQLRTEGVIWWPGWREAHLG